MPLVTTKEMFAKAYNGGYAVGAFNVNNMEIVQGITESSWLRPPLLRILRFPSPCTWTMVTPLSCASPASTVVLPLS